MADRPMEINALGKFYYRRPYGSDRIFVVDMIVLAFLTISRIVTNNSNGGFDTSTTYSVLTGLGDAIIGTIVLFLVIWLVSLFWLKPRRAKDIQNVNANGQEGIAAIALVRRPFWKSKLFYSISLVVGGLALIGHLNQPSRLSGLSPVMDSINSSIHQVSLAEVPLSASILGVSDGSLTIEEAQTKWINAESGMSIALSGLRAACETLPSATKATTQEDRIFNASINAYSIICSGFPIEYAESIAVFKAQITPGDTQADVNLHLAKIRQLGIERRQAFAKLVTASEGFFPKSETDALKAMINNLE